MPNPKWPSVEEQLAAHKIAPGSALEQLVRDNQDFHMLHPHEADDRLGLPPWLRVYWRKQHPGSRHAAGDPSGGYPLVLRKILHAMLHNQDKPTGLPAPPPPAAPRTPSSRKKGEHRGR